MILKYWKLAVVFALAAVIAIQTGRLTVAKSELRATEASLGAALSANKTNTATIDTLKRTHRQDLRDLAELYKSRQARQVATVIQLEAIANAPASDTGPMSPVLSRVVDGLRAKGGDRNQDREANPAR